MKKILSITLILLCILQMACMNANDADKKDSNSESAAPKDSFAYESSNLKIFNSILDENGLYGDDLEELQDIPSTVKSRDEALEISDRTLQSLFSVHLDDAFKTPDPVLVNSDDGNMLWLLGGDRIVIDAQNGILIGGVLDHTAQVMDKDALKNSALAYAALLNEAIPGLFQVSEGAELIDYSELALPFENEDACRYRSELKLYSQDGGYAIHIYAQSTKNADGTTYTGDNSSKFTDYYMFGISHSTDTVSAEKYCFAKSDSIALDDAVTANCGLTAQEAENILKTDLPDMFEKGVLPCDIDLNDYNLTLNGYVRLISESTMQSLWDFDLVNKTTNKKISVRIDPKLKRISNICFEGLEESFTLDELMSYEDAFLTYLGYEPLIRKNFISRDDFSCAGQYFYDNYDEKYPERGSNDGVYAAQNTNGDLSIYFTNSYDYTLFGS